MSMNADIKKEWLARLRQPERVQGYQRLRRKDGEQCCLDVLMEMGVEAGVQTPPVLATDEGCEYYQYDNAAGVPEKGLLTKQVIDWSGVEDLDPFIEIPDEETFEAWTLSSLNDSGDYDFAQIADIIEKSSIL